MLLKKLYDYLRPYLPMAVGSFVFSLLLAGIKGYQAYLVKPIFDKGLSVDADFQYVIFLCGILLGLSVLNFPVRFFHFYWIRFVVEKITCDIRDSIFSKLQKLPMNYYTTAKQGSLISQIFNDTSLFAGGFRNAIDLIREPITALVMFGVALSRDWQLTLVVVVASPLFIIIFNKSGKKIRQNQFDVQERLADMGHRINEGISGQKVVKTFNLQNYVLSRFKKSQESFLKSQMRTVVIEEIAHPLVEFIGALAFIGVILFAHGRISSGAMSTGDFVSFVTALALLMDPIRKYSQANVKMNQARAAATRILDFLSIPEEKSIETSPPINFKNSLEIQNVSFSYGEGEILKNVSVSIPKGKKVAFVGASGSGKSTLLNLLLGLYPLEQGKILIDEKPISDLSFESLRSLFGYVGQDVFLFHDSILENLQLGHQYPEKQINDSLEVSCSQSFISSLDQGIHTMVGDRGARLSGGQKQRLTIARAFLRNPEVLLFDEATSSLDNESEKWVQMALDQLSSQKTLVAVAHRLSTIQNFDKIYVFKEGSIIESGTHEELMGLTNEYCRLYQLTQR